MAHNTKPQMIIQAPILTTGLNLILILPSYLRVLIKTLSGQKSEETEVVYSVIGRRRDWEGGGIGREAVYDIPDPETPVLRLVCSPGRSVL